MLRKIIKKSVRVARRWSKGVGAGADAAAESPFIYPWLNKLCEELVDDDPRMRPAYLWGSLHAAHVAKTLGIPAISLIEFGVAGGNGLVALDVIAQRIERTMGVRISVYGFDTGEGLPEPEDLRDCPNLFTRGGFPMVVDDLRARLVKAKLVLGAVEKTLPSVVDEFRSSPVAFISFDLDYYSSTMAALRLFDLEASMFLPRVHCYFDDITGFTYCEFNGERLAISEFNGTHAQRKIAPIYALRHYVPGRFANSLWVEKYFMAHLFDHELYARPDGLLRQQRMDLAKDRRP
jgi:hypothetical protein